MNSATIVQKLWNYCNVLRDDGMSYGDYVLGRDKKCKPGKRLFAEIIKWGSYGLVTGSVFPLSSSMRAMASIGWPVSMAVELATLVISALRNFSGLRRYGLVSMSGFSIMLDRIEPAIM